MELLLILKQKNKVLNIALIITALFFARGIYKKQVSQLEYLRQRQIEETERNDILEGISALEKRINVYGGLLPKKDANTVINYINGLAKEMNIGISSIKPEAEQRHGDYIIKTPFTLSITTDSYHNIGKFISRMENSQDFYVVENIDIKPEKEEGLSATLKISSLAFIRPPKR